MLTGHMKPTKENEQNNQKGKQNFPCYFKCKNVLILPYSSNAYISPLILDIFYDRVLIGKCI